jgi:Tol biopolymer transport system component
VRRLGRRTERLRIEVDTIRRDGTREQRLTRGKWNYDPEWSPDGTRVGFAREYSPDGGIGEAWVVVADGRNPRLLTGAFKTYDRWALQLSPLARASKRQSGAKQDA